MEEVEKLIKEGKYKDAINLVKGQKDSPIKFYYLALIYFKSGNLKEALRFAEKAKRTSNEPRFSTLYGYILYSLGYEQQDVELLERALKEMQKALQTNKQLEYDPEFLCKEWVKGEEGLTKGMDSPVFKYFFVKVSFNG